MIWSICVTETIATALTAAETAQARISTATRRGVRRLPLTAPLPALQQHMCVVHFPWLLQSCLSSCALPTLPPRSVRLGRRHGGSNQGGGHRFQGQTHPILPALRRASVRYSDDGLTGLVQLVREHKSPALPITLERADERASMGTQGRLGSWPPTPSRPSTSPARPQTARWRVDKQAVASQLRTKGLIVVDIEEQQPANAGDILARFQRIKSDELVIATRQLSTMVNSGMSLLRSLYVIEEQTENDTLRDIWVEVRKDVEGAPLSAR